MIVNVDVWMIFMLLINMPILGPMIRKIKILYLFKFKVSNFLLNLGQSRTRMHFFHQNLKRNLKRFTWYKTNYLTKQHFFYIKFTDKHQGRITSLQASRILCWISTHTLVYGPNAPALDGLCIWMMQISSMYIGHEEDFNFILFNHFQSKCLLDTGPWWPLYMNGIALMHINWSLGGRCICLLSLN